MPNPLSALAALVLGLILMLGYPTLNNFERLDDVSQLIVESKTTNIVDSARALGYITKSMYEKYARELSATGNIYDIELEHYHTEYFPVYDDYDAFTGNYEPVEMYISNEEIMRVIDTNGIYYFSKGDTFNMKVKNINKTHATLFEERLYNWTFDSSKIFCNYGGMVRNEVN